MPWVWPALRGQNQELSWIPIWKKDWPAQMQGTGNVRCAEQRLTHLLTVMKALLATLHFVGMKYFNQYTLCVCHSLPCPLAPHSPRKLKPNLITSSRKLDSFCKIRFFNSSSPLLLCLSSFLLNKYMNIIDIQEYIFCPLRVHAPPEGENLFTLWQNLLNAAGLCSEPWGYSSWQ